MLKRDVKLQLTNFWMAFDVETSCQCDCVSVLFSGVIMSHGSTSAAATISELTAYSGSAYLYFYSDAAVNMSGFSIRYRFVMLLFLLSHHTVAWGYLVYCMFVCVFVRLWISQQRKEIAA